MCVNNIIFRLSNPTERNPKQQLQDPKRKKESQGWICLKPAYFYFFDSSQATCVSTSRTFRSTRGSQNTDPTMTEELKKKRSPLSPTSSVIRHVANIRHFNPDPKPQFMTINNKIIIYTENGFANGPSGRVDTGKLVAPGLRVCRRDLTECISRRELGRLVKNKQAKSSERMSVINL